MVGYLPIVKTSFNPHPQLAKNHSDYDSIHLRVQSRAIGAGAARPGKTIAYFVTVLLSTLLAGSKVNPCFVMLVTVNVYVPCGPLT